MEQKTAYFKQNTRIGNFIQIPRFVLAENISISAKLVYGFLMARTLLSQKERNHQGWTDEAGNIFIYYSIQNIARDSKLSESTVKNALKELKSLNLIETKRTGFNRPNRIYVKYIPENPSANEYGQILTYRADDNCLSGGQNPTQLEGQNLAPIYTDRDIRMINSNGDNLTPDLADPEKVKSLVSRSILNIRENCLKKRD